MTDEASSPELVITSVDRGWALLDRAAWETINASLEMISALEQCSTWGEYRELRSDTTDEILLQYTNLDPDEDEEGEESFEVDLSDVEGLDRNAMLEAATRNFIDSLPDASFLNGKVDDAETWSWIEYEHRNAVVRLLRKRGYSVKVEDE